MTGGWPCGVLRAATCSSPTSTLGTDDLVFAYTSATGFAPVAAIFEIAISANAP